MKPSLRSVLAARSTSSFAGTRTVRVPADFGAQIRFASWLLGAHPVVCRELTAPTGDVFQRNPELRAFIPLAPVLRLVQNVPGLLGPHDSAPEERRAWEALWRFQANQRKLRQIGADLGASTSTVHRWVTQTATDLGIKLTRHHRGPEQQA